jgi:hypothetical protein
VHLKRAICARHFIHVYLRRDHSPNGENLVAPLIFEYDSYGKILSTLAQLTPFGGY